MYSGKHILLAFVTLLILSPLCTYAQKSADAVLGVWYNGSKESKIEIFKCGNQYCGKIIWLREPNTDGKPKTDKNNPDEKLRNRPVAGMQLMKNFTYSGENIWEEGEIYNPKSGKTYSCKMTLIDKNTLDLRGFIGISLIGKTDTWTRVE
jgi:uncharacterized protein (DUF2147 family)